MKKILSFVNKNKNKIVTSVAVISGVVGIITSKTAIKAVKIASDVKAKLEKDVETCVEMGESVGYTEEDKNRDTTIVNVQHKVACVRAWVLPIASFTTCIFSTLKLYKSFKHGDIAVPESVVSYLKSLKLLKYKGGVCNE